MKENLHPDIYTSNFASPSAFKNIVSSNIDTPISARDGIPDVSSPQSLTPHRGSYSRHKLECKLSFSPLSSASSWGHSSMRLDSCDFDSVSPLYSSQNSNYDQNSFCYGSPLQQLPSNVNITLLRSSPIAANIVSKKKTWTKFGPTDITSQRQFSFKSPQSPLVTGRNPSRLVDMPSTSPRALCTRMQKSFSA